MDDARRVVELEAELALANETVHRIATECENMLVQKDRAFRDKCLRCRGSRL